MKYRIKSIKSKGKARERIVLWVCVMLYFLCFALSEAYCDNDFPRWIFETYEKLPK